MFDLNGPFLPITIFFVFAPIIIIYLEGKYKVVRKVGAVLICYAIGVIVGNTGFFPTPSEGYLEALNGAVHLPHHKIKELLEAGIILKSDATRNAITFLQDKFTSISILISLPLILFSLDVKKWMRYAASASTSLGIGLFTVLLMIFVGYWLFGEKIDDGWKVSGMLVGVYTGGTPNMAAIKTALNVSQEMYILTHTYEMMLGAIYLIFIFSIGQRVFLTFLPAFKSPETGNIEVGPLDLQTEMESYNGIFERKIFVPLMGALGLSILILGVSFGLGSLFPGEFSAAATVILVTTFGIVLSFIPKIKNIKKTFQLGMYFILIFCLAVASQADISKLANISLNLFYFVGFAMFGSHILHAIIARFFKIDADTVIISGSALICSPPFVPAVAGALKNREVILTGMVVGIAGYAVGNYLGVLVAYILK